jgi:hypothetical protein
MVTPDPHHLPQQYHEIFEDLDTDLRGTHFGREQIAMAQRLYAVCRLTYSGADPLGLGLGWCCVGASIAHKTHQDQYGRVWETAEYAVRDASVTMTPLDYDARPVRDSDHKPHKKG